MGSECSKNLERQMGQGPPAWDVDTTLGLTDVKDIFKKWRYIVIYRYIICHVSM